MRLVLLLGGFVDHALKRAAARLPLFEKDGDFAACQRAMALAQARCPIRSLGYCLLPHHWHFVLGPAKKAVGESKAVTLP